MKLKVAVLILEGYRKCIQLRKAEELSDEPSIEEGYTALDVALEKSVQALEKQIQKAPVQKEDSDLGYAWYCPDCGCFIDPSTYKFCPNCGQAIKKE